MQYNEYENGLYLGNENNLYLALIDTETISFTSFNINSNCKIIGNSAFYNCSSLTSIIIPSSVTVIEWYAFSDCPALISIIFEDDSQLKSIGSYAFEDCNNLASITIPSSVTSIGSSAFSGCSNIRELRIDDLTSYLNISFGGLFSSPLYDTNQNVSLYENENLVTNLVIPEDVTTIPDYAFSQLSITSVEISSSVTSIGEYAFSYCSSLTSITIPSSVTSIGDSAFYDCSNIQELRIDDLTSYLNSLATNYSSPLRYTDQNVSLYENGNLVKNLVIPSTITTIPSCAFKSLNITSVEIPNSVTSIGDGAFSNCDSLTSVTFEEDSQLISIGGEAFEDCINLASINIPEGITAINGYTFENCDSLTTITIPNSVTSIGIYAFNDCSNLTSITIPSSVTSIKKNAFQSCLKLVEVYNLSNLSITAGSSNNGYVGYYAKDIKTDESIINGGFYYSDDSREYLMYEDLKGNHYLVSYLGVGGEIELPRLEESQTYEINSGAFFNSDIITCVTIPETVTSIGDYAFYDCDSLSSITIPESVTSIGEWAFHRCSSLTSITIPSSVTSIGSYAFFYCYKLVEVINLSSLNITAGSSGNGYVGIYAIDIKTDESMINGGFYYSDDSREYLMYEDLKGNHYLVNYLGEGGDITLPTLSNNYSINKHAFYNLDITSVEISSSVTSIGRYAFYRCSNLTSITIPSSVTSIGDSAFNDCSSLTSITIPNSVTSIGSSAFYNCTGLTTVTFEDMTGLSEIGSNVFDGCSNVETLTILSGEVKNSGFSSFTNLTTVILEEGVTSIGSSAFYNCTGLTTVTFEEGSELVSIGMEAFYNCSSLTSITIPSTITSIGSYAFRDCSNLTIYCEVESKPSGWSSSWNNSNCPVYFGLNVNWKYDEVTGEPRPIGE